MATQKVLCVKTPRKKAELLKRKLNKLDILDSQYLIASDANFVYFPVTDKLRGHRLSFVYRKLKKRGPDKRKSSERLKKLGGPSSYEVVGDILILRIPEEEKKNENKVAKLLLKQNKSVRMIVKAAGAYYGKYRIRKLKILEERKTKKRPGLAKWETIHTESGCRFKLDVRTVYFSPRLSFERLRISELVKRNEIIFEVGTGVGPFAIIIAKQNPSVVVYANEFNPDAVKYLKENIKLNKLTNITVVSGDIRQISKRERYIGIADRVIIHTPMQISKLLKSSLKLAKNKSVIHYYEFTESKEETVRKIKTIQASVRVMGSRVVKTYSPTSVEVVVDFILG